MKNKERIKQKQMKKKMKGTFRPSSNCAMVSCSSLKLLNASYATVLSNPGGARPLTSAREKR